jgi:hypothetical protein
VDVELDPLFTTIGPIDPERRETWTSQFAAAKPFVAKLLGSEDAAQQFCHAFLSYYGRPDTCSYTALFFTRGHAPDT